VAGQRAKRCGMMNFLAALEAPAAPASALDRLKAIPPEFWLRLGVAIIAIVAFVIFLRKVAKMNKVVLTVVTFITVTVVGFNWIYERSEPEWATPVVSFLAGWFPTKGPPPKKPASSLAQKRE
jgi:apolipoprotein N-acyltransferase